MEPIRNYVEAMFSTLPQSPDLESMKLEMLENLEEKYNALLSEGKNPFEAAGIVLSSVGTAEELRKELEIEQEVPASFSHAPEPKPDFSPLPQQLAAYRDFRARYGAFTAFSVVLFILSPAVFLIFETFMPSRLADFATLPFFSCIAAGVAMLIHHGIHKDFYSHVLGLGGPRKTSIAADDPQVEEYFAFTQQYSYAVAAAVALFILSPAVFTTIDTLFQKELIGMLPMFAFIACGVALLICYGTRAESYQEQLGFQHKVNQMHISKERGSWPGLFAGIAFPLATIVFLFLGLFYNRWHPSWIVFPICGVLTGTVAVIEDFVIANKHP